jgi:hypothetical protein
MLKDPTQQLIYDAESFVDSSSDMAGRIILLLFLHLPCTTVIDTIIDF